MLGCDEVGSEVLLRLFRAPLHLLGHDVIPQLPCWDGLGHKTVRQAPMSKTAVVELAEAIHFRDILALGELFPLACLAALAVNAVVWPNSWVVGGLGSRV